MIDNHPHRVLRHHVARLVATHGAITERRCYCPDDCPCHRRPHPVCGCQQHTGPFPLWPAPATAPTPAPSSTQR